MDKTFKKYLIIWVVLLAAFNIICFALPSTYTVGNTTLTKFDGSFWTGYVVITLTFIGQLFCTREAFKATSKEKMFLNMSLVSICYTSTIVMIVVAAICMCIPNCPYFISIVVCVIALAFSIIAVIKASMAIDIVEQVDEKIKTQTSYIKMLTVDAEGLVNRAKTEEIKTECKKVFEAVRYSDPMSTDDLKVVEAQITVKMSELLKAVESNGLDDVKKSAEEILILIKDRNSKCKALK